MIINQFLMQSSTIQMIKSVILILKEVLFVSVWAKKSLVQPKYQI